MEQKSGLQEAFLRLVAIVGLVAVLILGAWGIILLAFNLVGLFTGNGLNFGSFWNNGNATAQEQVVATLPATAQSGKSFTASWVHKGGDVDAEYAYTLSYACKDSLTVEAALPQGGYQEVDCETPFNFSNTAEKTTLMAKVAGNVSVPLTLTVSANDIATGEETAVGSATMTITPAGKTTTTKPTTPTSTTKPTAVYTAAPRVSQLYGLPDLTVTMTSVTSLSSIQGRTVVQFTVTNAGTNVALQGWAFNAVLPLNPSYTYQSQGQQALYPGDSIAYTLTYDDPNFRNYNYNQNQYCTLQYPNYNCNYQQYPYNYNTQPQTCYTYNGYQNVAGPCPLTYDSYGNPIYQNYGNQYNQYPYNYANPNYGYYPYNRTVTVNVDPFNWVMEAVEYNNSASKSF